MPRAGESGRGFGLFSVRERLELFGGKLEIQSAPGRGCRIFASVPLARQPAAPAESGSRTEEWPNPSDPAPTPSQNPNKKIRVLLADDHAILRQGIGNMLRNEPDIDVGGEVGDGREAVRLAVKLLPDVVLMDMSMPNLNGEQATRILHKDHPQICVIGLSMFEEAERAQAIVEAGAVCYLSKSDAGESLIATVRKYGASSSVSR